VQAQSRAISSSLRAKSFNTMLAPHVSLTDLDAVDDAAQRIRSRVGEMLAVQVPNQRARDRTKLVCDEDSQYEHLGSAQIEASAKLVERRRMRVG